MRKLTWFSNSIYREQFFTDVGFSVRCVKN
jgi:hypothetical protein